METNLRTLGSAEAKVVLSLREQNREVVCASDIISLLGSEQTGRKVIRNLIRKGWLLRLVGGRYMLLPPEYGPENLGENNVLAAAAAMIETSYIGWWSAAAFHGFTTQKPMSVAVAALRQARARTIEESEVRFVKVAKRKFFSFETYDVYGRSVKISSPEKTVVDCIDRPDLSGGPTELARITHTAMNSIEPDVLADTALKMESTALLQRLGFLTGFVVRPLPDEICLRIRAAIPKSNRSHFGRAKPKVGDIGYVAAWGLFVNVRRKELLAEVPPLLSGRQPKC